MSGLFRSEDMVYVRIIMADDAAYDTVRELGNFEKLHVVDLSDSGNASMSQETSSLFYKKRVAQCQAMERKLHSFREAFAQYNIQLPDAFNPDEVRIDDLRAPDVLEECRQMLEPLEETFTRHVMFRKQHQQQINEHHEFMEVLKCTANSELARFAPPPQQQRSGDHYQFEDSYEAKEAAELMEGGGRSGAVSKFTSRIWGVIPQDKIIAFERLLFRVSRGNAFCNFFEIPQLLQDPVSGEPVKKSVFNVTFMGEQLSRRISRIAQYAGATEYAVPSSEQAIMATRRDLTFKLNDSQSILRRTDQEIRDLLSEFAHETGQGHVLPARSPYLNWLSALQKERRICDVLRKCEQEGPHSKMITLEGWTPKHAVEDLRMALHNAVRVSQAKQAALQTWDSPPNNATPPTHFPTNAFTGSFQSIVDTYGVPRYKEVNPGLFTIISFPFMFGVMFGDIGHGALLLIFALYLLWNEKKFLAMEQRGQLSEIPSMVFGGRYLLVIMGAFAFYAGLVYNDLFSVPVNLFESGWAYNSSRPFDEYEGPYAFGIDPAWYHTTNQLAFFNSFKMKLAVTLGVVQMTFGIVLAALNNLYFGNKLAIFFEFIPRLVFMLCTFGYMVFIIILKLCINWGPGDTPPLLIQTMIQMFLSPGSVDKENELYTGQAAVQAILLLLAVFSVPFMLFPVPCINNYNHKEYMKRIQGSDGEIIRQEIQMHDVGFGDPSASSLSLQENLLSDSDRPTRRSAALIIDDRDEESKDEMELHADMDSEAPLIGGQHGPSVGEDYSYSDDLIVQGIHTIEFVLGTVSNTASYLRLWALSLAHAQLSEVFWSKMIMQYGIEAENPFMAVVGFALWAVATFAVLMSMDMLECFLHALRLHWVEFQNKFFHADGYAFEPFTFSGLGKESNL